MHEQITNRSQLVLVVHQPDAPAQEVFLQHSLTIGRSNANAVCVPAAQVESVHARIARNHTGGLDVVAQGEAWIGGCNGSADTKRISLQHGVQFRIGPATFTCRQLSPQSQSMQPAQQTYPDGALQHGHNPNHIPQSNRQANTVKAWLVGLLIGCAVVSVLNAGFYLIGTGIASDEDIAALEGFETVEGGFGCMSLPVWITTAVLFSIWLHGTSKRASALRGAPLQFSPGWSVAWFWIPLANIVMPHLVMRDLWRACAADPRQQDTWRHSPVSPLIDAWGILWIATWVLLIPVLGLLFMAGYQGNWQLLAGGYCGLVLSELVNTALVILTALMVRKVGHSLDRSVELAAIHHQTHPPAQAVSVTFNP